MTHYNAKTHTFGGNIKMLVRHIKFYIQLQVTGKQTCLEKAWAL